MSTEVLGASDISKCFVSTSCPPPSVGSLPTPSRAATLPATSNVTLPAAFGGNATLSAVLTATKGKTYDIVGSEEAAAKELRADHASLKAVLGDMTLELVDELVVTCEALRKWMRKVDVDLSAEMADLQGIVEKARGWQRQSAGDSENSRHLFPFAQKMYSSVNDLVRCVDQLQQIYGKELDGMGLHLPMIVAVGTESAGKSSVMEMIAGQPFFPRHEGTCTRLPFRLQFRSSENAAVSFQGFSKFGKCGTPVEVQDRIAEITKERTNNKDVSTEEVVLNIDMVDVPELTLVDLPGLIGTSYAREGPALKEKVQNLVKSYVKQPHAIVLAVAAANTRLRDSEVFGMVKELGAEDRTIGLLTKCDLATDKRWRLEDKIGQGLAEATPEEQEKAGFIPLQRGYFGMICRDTENSDRKAELQQDQGAIDSVKARESQAFDEIMREPKARERCGVDKVYNALTSIFQEYIQNTWRPDAMKKLGEKISVTRQDIADLRFSDRYEDPPPSCDAKTVKYQQEVVDRIWKFDKDFSLFVQSAEIESRLLSRLPKLLTAEDSALSLVSLSSQIKAAFAQVLERLQGSLDCILKVHSSTKFLPILRSLILMHTMEQVNTWVKMETDTLAGLVAVEGIEPLENLGPYRVKVPQEIQEAVVRMSEEDDCSICHESMYSGDAVDLLQCCSKHFHHRCLEKSLNSHTLTLTCPLCRTSITARPSNHGGWKRKQMREAGNRLLEHAKRSVAVVLHNLRAMKIGRELEEKLKIGTKATWTMLLDETPELQNHRIHLRERLSVLQRVEEDINTWSDL